MNERLLKNVYYTPSDPGSYGGVESLQRAIVEKIGKRVNEVQYVAQPGERIDYYDFTSLYPYVNKSKTYPIGHPTVIFRDFEPLDNYFGIVRAKVLPPRGLWSPVLPYRVQ
ncbi:uncharacterized protein LOC125146163 [Tachysurus ichikawai]